MQMTTRISADEEGRHTLRGHPLQQLIRERSFCDLIFLLWRGNFPLTRETTLLNAVLVSAVEHGVGAPSIFVPRVVTSCGQSLSSAVAAGVLAIGDRHGGAGASVATVLLSRQSPVRLVREYAQARKRVPGYGHKTYVDEDPRATVLARLAKRLRFPCRYFTRAYAIERVLSRSKGKKVPLNIDGAIAAAMLELRFPAQFSTGAFLLARVGGMIAHSVEEQEGSRTYHRLSLDADAGP